MKTQTIETRPIASLLADWITARATIKLMEMQLEKMRPALESYFPKIGETVFGEFVITRIKSEKTTLDRELMKRRLGFEYDSFLIKSESISLKIQKKEAEE